MVSDQDTLLFRGVRIKSAITYGTVRTTLQSSGTNISDEYFLCGTFILYFPDLSWSSYIIFDLLVLCVQDRPVHVTHMPVTVWQMCYVHQIWWYYSAHFCEFSEIIQIKRSCNSISQGCAAQLCRASFEVSNNLKQVQHWPEKPFFPKILEKSRTKSASKVPKSTNTPQKKMSGPNHFQPEGLVIAQDVAARICRSAMFTNVLAVLLQCTHERFLRKQINHW